LIDGYEVYRSTQSGGPYSRITPSLLVVPWFTDTSVAAGQTYYYVVTAVAGSIESGYSNETIATIPLP
jgi:fibronectin type 3 domain-containing protein